MEIVIEHRAEIALRSLNRNERKQISAALKKISAVTLNKLSQIPNLHKFNALEKLYEYRISTGNQRLSLVCSFEIGKCIIEDVVAQDKLKRLLLNLGQK